MNRSIVWGVALAAVLSAPLAAPLSVSASAAQLPGLGQVEGVVSSPTSAAGAKITLKNVDKNVFYTVFAAKGRYRAVNMFPGRYDVTVDKPGLALPAKSFTLAADGKVTVDLALAAAPIVPTYVGGRTLEDIAEVVPYQKLYPPGPGRDVMDRTCIVCHGVNFLPTLPQAREGWDSQIDFMTKDVAFAAGGIEDGPSLMPPLSDVDRKVLLDYLEANFGADKPPRAVMDETATALDEEALGKAQYIQYQFPNTSVRPHRWTQETHFDQQGNVWVTERGTPASIVRLDPRTGEFRDYDTKDPKWSPHGLTVDADGSVWWAGRDNFLVRLDPKTGLSDHYPVTKPGLHGHTPVFTSKGDLWFTMLPSNKLGHWDRKTDKITYYESPEPRARPYGIIIDQKDKIWYVEYHTSAVVRFDPETEQFKRYPVPSAPTSLRRLGIDNDGNPYYGVYGAVGGQAGIIGRIDAATGKITEFKIPVLYSNPYDVWADDNGIMWITCDNYLVSFDPKTEKFTPYPMPVRTDEPKMSVTRDGAVWFTPRMAGMTGNWGGGASVMYPDKDKITTLAAYYSDKNTANHIAKYKGPVAPVTGATRTSQHGAKNAAVAVTAPSAPKAPAREGTRGGMAD